MRARQITPNLIQLRAPRSGERDGAGDRAGRPRTLL